MVTGPRAGARGVPGGAGRAEVYQRRPLPTPGPLVGLASLLRSRSLSRLISLDVGDGEGEGLGDAPGVGLDEEPDEGVGDGVDVGPDEGSDDVVGVGDGSDATQIGRASCRERV